jgi:D-arabinitol dehydrogenase (NADP+)
MAAVENLPKDMEALWYESATKFDIRRVPIPEINDEEVLVKGKIEHASSKQSVGSRQVFLVTLSGWCGTDQHIHEGEFNVSCDDLVFSSPLTSCLQPSFPLIPGHEAVGRVAAYGKNVKGFQLGDKCAADVGTVSAT